MSRLIDERGSLFGRFNMIDVAAVVIVVVVIPMIYVAYRTFRQPSPVITSVTPSTLSVESLRRVRLKGRNFRPFLNAFVAKTNEPYSVPFRVADTVQAAFLIETPTVVELQLPNVAPGTYDIYLYDEGREVAHQTAAITLTAAAKAPVAKSGDPVPDIAVVDINVRFNVDHDILPLVKADAVDLNMPDNGHPATTPARLLSIRRASDAGGDVSFRLADGSRLLASVAATYTPIEATVQLGVSQDHGVWVYADGQRIRAGEGFSFTTADYLIRGLITRLVTVRPQKTARASRGDEVGRP